MTPRSWWINKDLEFGAVVCVRIIETTWCFVDKRLGEPEGILTRFERSKNGTNVCPPDRDRVHKRVNGGLRIGELRLNVGGLVDPSWIGRRKKEKAEYRNGTPEEKETDEVALRALERRKRGWIAKKLPRTLIKAGGQAGENFHFA